jgi:predicted ABC-type ATPase
MQSPTTKPTKPGEVDEEAAARKPDVCVGDDVFFNHPDGPMSGRVTAAGEHGATLDANGVTHKIKWPHIVGHKRRAPQNYQITESGEDGHIVTDQNGKRVFFLVPNEAHEDPLMAKAAKGGAAFAGRAGLQKKVITEKGGKQNTHWVRTGKDQPAQDRRKTAAPAAAGGGKKPPLDSQDRRQAAPVAAAGGGGKKPPPDSQDQGKVGSAQGYGTQHFEAGHKVKFAIGSMKGEGTIIGEPGDKGAHVKDASGHVHQVEWGQVTGRGGDPPKKDPPGGGYDENAEPPIDPDQFSAADFAKQHDQADVSVESVMSQFPPETQTKIDSAVSRLKSIEETIDTQKKDGNWLPERQAKHRDIYQKIMGDAQREAATPAPGEKPIFTMLGGRGGSGKSWFKGNVYDPKKVILLDGDAIKAMLPEYAGWNAHQLHEEASSILEDMLTRARDMGLNVVLDATMKTGKSAMEKINGFKDHGYRTECHYMHLPRQEAAKRAVDRFVNGGKPGKDGKEEEGRFVPVNAVLANTKNEENFDEARKHVDKWSFHDNNVPKGSPPKLISKSKSTDSKLTKSEQRSIILVWRR